MATYYSEYNNTYRLRLEVTNRDGNSATNTSVIDYGFYLEQTSKRFNGTVQTGDLTINGVSLYTKPASFNSTVYPYNSSILLKSGSLTVSHTSDGSKTVALVANYSANSGGNGPVGLAINTTFALTTIPRASQPTLDVYNQALGGSINIYTNRASSSFTHTLTYTFGNQTNTIASNVSTSVSWTLPWELANAIPNSPTGWGTITCYTYNGGTHIGTKSISFTAVVPNDGNFQPNASITSILEGASLPIAFSVFIQGKSRLRVISIGSGKFGAGISQYRVSVDGTTYTGADITSAFIQKSGSIPISLTATDTRGYSTTISTNVTVYPYSSPQLTGYSAKRSPNEQGTDLTVMIDFSISPLGNQNGKVCSVSYREIGGTWEILLYHDTYYTNTFTQTASGVLDVNKSYEVMFYASDIHFNSVTKIVNVGTAFQLIDFNKSGKGMAVGKVSESDSFEVAIPQINTEGIYSSDNFVSIERNGRIGVQDTRSTDTPTRFEGKGVMFEFKSNTTDGLNQGGDYHGVMTFQKWNHDSGGKTHQLAFTDWTTLHHRSAVIGGTWSEWYTIWGDASVQYGSNSNGEYLRFPNGIQICWHRATSDSAITTASGAMFASESQIWTFPAVFTDYPVTSVSESHGVGSSIGALGTTGTTNIRTSFRFFRSSSAYGAYPIAVLYAIGRWK